MRAVERYEVNCQLLERSRTYTVQREFLLREHDVRLEFEPEQLAKNVPTLLERTLGLPTPRLFTFSIDVPFGSEQSTLFGSTLIATISDDALHAFSQCATYGLLGVVTAGVLLYAETELRGETLNYRQPDLNLALELLAARGFQVNMVPYHLERQRLLDAKFAECAVPGVSSLQRGRTVRESKRIADQLLPFVPAQAHRMKVGLEGRAL